MTVRIGVPVALVCLALAASGCRGAGSSKDVVLVTHDSFVITAQEKAAF